MADISEVTTARGPSSALLAIKGLLSHVPGLQAALYRGHADPAATSPARYCYGVWLKHLALLWCDGMHELPRTVVELGPGSSLGAGIAALLSGAGRYAAIDAVRHATASTDSVVLAELAKLIQERSPRPHKGWPDYDECLDQRLFPGHILTEARLQRSLAPRRLQRLAEAIATIDSPCAHPMIQYATWSDRAPFEGAQADLLFSHAVLDQVEDLEATYTRCARLVRAGGWMSHHIDFSSLGVTPEWNGHLGYEEWMWKLITGRRPYFVNRERCSTHLALMHRHGFDVVSVRRRSRADGIERWRLARRWRGLSDDDLACCEAFVVARKR